MKIKIPEHVEYIIDTLTNNGYEAYAVGGCVRDTILGRVPGDWDITTSAKPWQVKELFRRTIDTGIEHGTVTVMISSEGYEVTTYRLDGEYEDNRHPKQVEFTGNLVEDLKRRDFTINAMAYNPVNGIVDEFQGLYDLNRRLIKCVGNPRERFDEDGLRILRAIRFAGQLEFQIDEKTKEAIKEKAGHLRNISAERIREELNKLLISKGADLLLTAYHLGITNIILPEFDKMLETPQITLHHQYNVGQHSLESLKYMNNVVEHKKNYTKKEQIMLAWTMLLHDVGKPDTKSIDELGKDHFYGHPDVSEKKAKEILRRLKFDNYTIDTACKLIRNHDYRIEPEKVAVRRAMNRIGEAIMPMFFLVQESDIMAQSTYKREEKLLRLNQVKALYEEIIRNKECVSLKDLKVNGSDLIEAGFKPGKELGLLLNELLERVIVNPAMNNKEQLLQYAKEIQVL